MSIHSTGLGDDESLAVSPKRAQRILDISHTKLYELIAEREIQSFKIGKARKVTVDSIRKYIARRLGEAA